MNGKKVEDIFITHTDGEIVYRHNYNYDNLLSKVKDSKSGVLKEFFNDQKALREMKINKFGLVHMSNDRKNKRECAFFSVNSITKQVEVV